VGGTGLTYDVKGNLTQAVTGHRYTWDFDNQLQGVDTSGDQVADVTFGYDALGRRVKKTASGATKIYVSATTPIAYSPQAGQELVEYVSGAVPTSPTEKCVYGNDIDEPIWKTGTGGAVYYHANSLYCVSALTNGSGAVVERYRYTPYGELTILAADGTTVRSASNYANPYTYTGRRWDSETGLYYHRARYYHPALGRFLGRDPIRLAAQLPEQYGYLRGRPFLFIDPSGKLPFFPCRHPAPWLPPAGPGLPKCRFGLYDDQDTGDATPGHSGAKTLHCSAQSLFSKSDVVPMAGKGVRAAVMEALHRECCISHLAVFDHGNTAFQEFGTKRGMTQKDLAQLCRVLCEDAEIELFGCHVGTPGNGTVAMLMTCPKVKKVSGCTSFVKHYRPYDDGTCSGYTPECTGTWREYPPSGRSLNPPSTIPPGKGKPK
jgi:RHS repeat-associated protein